MLRALLSGPGARTGSAETYTAIPSGRTPRLLVPSRDRRVSAAAIRHVIAPSSARARLRQATLVGVFAAGVGDLLFRDRLRIDGGTTLAAHLSAAIGSPVRVSVRCGPPRANRKPVLQLLDDAGRAVAFAKVGINDLTRALVRAETAALGEIEDRDLGPVRAPRVLHAGSWQDDAELLVIDALPVWGAPGKPTAALRVDAMRSVAGNSTARRLAGAPYLDRLSTRVAALGDRPAISSLQRTLSQARTVDVELPFAAWHGDWNGGNMAVRDGRVLLWDWERYEPDVPLGFDMLHYELHEEVTVRGTDPGPAIVAMLDRCPAMLAPFGLDPARARAVVALYLTEIATRYLGDGQEQGSTRLGRAGVWIDDALAAAGDWSTELQGVASHGA